MTVLSLDDIIESYDMRRVLELYAAELAVLSITESELVEIRRTLDALDRKLSTGNDDQVYLDCLELDHQFHRLIVDSAGNSRLRAFWDQINVYVQVARIRHGRMDVEWDFPIFQQVHREMADALENRDLALLSRLTKDHIEQAKQGLFSVAGDLARPGQRGEGDIS